MNTKIDPNDDAAAADLAQFQAAVLLRNRTRPHFGKLTHATQLVVGANPLCGDQLTVELEVKDGNITQCRFHGEMSTISIAAAEVLCTQIEGLSLRKAELVLQTAQLMLAGHLELASTDEFQCFALVRRYPSRLKTATLPVSTLLAAVRGDATQVSTE